MSKAIVNTLESLETGEQFDVRDIAQLSAGYQRQKNQIFLELRRLAAEAGFNLVDGSFEEGGVLNELDDVLWYQANGKYYSWGTDEVKGVPANSTPATTGGIGATAWVDRTDVTLRSEINLVQRTFSSVSEMKSSLNSSDIGKPVEWLSYYSGWAATISGGSGGNKGVVVPAGTGVADDGSIFDTVSGVQVVAFFDSEVSVAQFGAVGDEDDTVKIQRAIEFASTKGKLVFEKKTYDISPKINHILWVYGKSDFIIDGNGCTLRYSSGRALNILDSKRIKVFDITFETLGTANAGIVVHCSSNGAGIDFDLEQWTDGIFEADDYRTEDIYISDVYVPHTTALACIYVGFAHDGAKDKGTTAGMVRNVVIDNCDLRNSTYHGVSCAFTKGLRVRNTYFNGNLGYCVDMSSATVHSSVEDCIGDNVVFAVKVQSAYSRDGSYNTPTGIVHNVGCNISRNSFIQQNIAYASGVTTWMILDSGIGTIIEDNTVYSSSTYFVYARGTKTTSRDNKINLIHDVTWNSIRVFGYYIAAFDTLGTNVAVRLGSNSLKVSGDVLISNKVSGSAAVVGGYKLYVDDPVSVTSIDLSGLFTEVFYINHAGNNNSIRNLSLYDSNIFSSGLIAVLRSSFTPTSQVQCKLLHVSGNTMKNVFAIIDSVNNTNFDDIHITDNSVEMAGVGIINSVYDGSRVDRLECCNNRFEFNTSADTHIVRSNILAHSVISNNHMVATASANKRIFYGYGTSPETLNIAAVGNVHTSFDGSMLNTTLPFNTYNQVALF